jgi:hypothetical protein
MGGRGRIARGCDHLVERTAMRELRIKLAAKFARPAGARIEALHDLCINMFHEGSPAMRDWRIREARFQFRLRRLVFDKEKGLFTTPGEPRQAPKQARKQAQNKLQIPGNPNPSIHPRKSA